MLNKIISKFIFLVAVLHSGLALSSDIQILNRNFDSDAIPPNPGYLSHISGWVNSGHGNIGVKAPRGNGVNYHDMGIHGQIGFLQEGARLTQTADTDLQSGETYTLTFDAGKPIGALGQDFMVRFKANGLALAQKQFDSTTVPEGEWATQSFSFTATSDMPIGKPLVIEFQNSAMTSGYELNLDNVYLDGAGTGEPLPPKVEGNNGLIMVGVNLTLKVPEVYADINAALDYMEDKFIKTGKIVTIKVSDCSNQSFAQSIDVAHPNGESIHIIGDTSNPANCVLNFVNSGFSVGNNHALGLIDGFHINGKDTGNGIYAHNGGSITVGENVWVSNFSIGLRAYGGGRIFADNVTSFGNTNSGFYADFNGILRAEYANSYDNLVRGYTAYNDGQLFADYSRAKNNLHQGYFSSDRSLLKAEHATSTNNTQQGYYAHNFSALITRFSSASGNGATDFYAHFMGFVDRVGDKGGSYSPFIGTEANAESILK